MRLRRVAEQQVDFSRSKIAGIYAHEDISMLPIDADFIDAFSGPLDRSPNLGKCKFYEFADGVAFSSRQNIVVCLLLLQHQPHAFDKIAGVAPVSLGVQVS